MGLVTLEDIRKDPRRHVYRTQRWRKLRAQVMRRAGWACRPCQREGRGVRAARIVHHIRPVRQAPELAFTITNLEPTCWDCHQQKHEQDITPDPTQRAWNSFYRELLPTT